MTDIFVWPPAANDTTVGTVTLRERSAKFGDGYEQRVVDGLNAVVFSGSVSFIGNADFIGQIEAFLDAHVGVNFLWTPPRRAQGYYKCTGYQSTEHGAGNATLAATFEQQFRP